MTGEQIQTNILEKLEEQGYLVDLAESKENNNVIIIEDLREFLKSQKTLKSLQEIEKNIESITNKNFELIHNCRLLRYIAKRLINFHSPESNIFKAIGFQEKTENILDLIIYINGIPLITWKIGEANESLRSIYEQLFKDSQSFEQIYSFNAFSLISKRLKEVRYGIPWIRDELNDSWGWEWRDLQGKDLCFKGTTIDYVIENLLNKKVLISIIKNFICFPNNNYEEKKICWCHQFKSARGIAREISSCIKSQKQKAGIHKLVSGSGRSHIMLFICRLLTKTNIPIAILTDRDDMRDKLFALFERNQDYLGQKLRITKAVGWKELTDHFKNPISKILFVNTASFRNIDLELYDENIVCFFYEIGILSLDGDTKQVTWALPQGIYIQISADKSKNYEKIFGEVFEWYQITDCEENKHTMAWDWEDRSKEQFYPAAGGAESSSYKKSSEADWIIRSKAVALDILKHYEKRFAGGNTTKKAIIMAHSRRCAIEIYLAFRENRPNWFSHIKNKESKMHLIMPKPQFYEQEFYFYFDKNSNTQKAINIYDLIGSEEIIEQLKRRFSVKDAMFSIAIVVGLLTKGIAYELLDTIYLDQKLSPSELKQVISRVNRNSENKTNALIVSYRFDMSLELQNLKRQS